MGKENNATIEDWCTGNICLLDMSATKSNKQDTPGHNHDKHTSADYDAVSSLLLLPIPQKDESRRKPMSLSHSSLSSFSTSSTSSGSLELRPSGQTCASLESFHNRSSNSTESVPIPEVENEHVRQAKALCHTLIDTHQRAIAFGPQSEQVLSAQGVRIYSTESLHAGNQRLDLKRYTAHFEVAASIQELASFLVPTETSHDRVQHCYDVLFPDVYGITTLWTGPASTTSQTRIQWKAQRMSTLFTRDRDLVVLEHHQTFPIKNGTRGLVHLLHSVEAPGYDPSLAHRANKRYVRAALHTSGLVATEVPGNPRVLQVSITLDMDLHDTSTSSQQKVAMVKRLQQWVEIRNLVWKSQMVHESNLFARQYERQAMTVGETLSPCEVCTELLAQNTKWRTTHTLDGTVPNAKTLCMCCERLLCGSSECTRITEFPSFLVQEDLQRSGKKWKVKSNTRRTMDCNAKLCTLCVKEYRTPEC